MIAYDIFLLAPCVSDAYAMDFLCCSRERREERRSLSGPPRFLPLPPRVRHTFRTRVPKSTDREDPYEKEVLNAAKKSRREIS